MRKKRYFSYVIGVDEAGRGPLAGPVTVGAVAVRSDFSFRNQKFHFPFRDSKKLSELQRLAWISWMEAMREKGIVAFTYANIFPSVIDRINISQAANYAAGRAVRRLMYSLHIEEKFVRVVYLDGGLFLRPLLMHATQRTIIKGDEKIPVVRLASIVAKVSRDRLMKRFAVRYPEYGFEIHKGYGTAAHRAAILRYGVSPFHRKTFIHISSSEKRR